MRVREVDQRALQPQYEPAVLRQLQTALCSETMTEVLGRDWAYLTRRGLVIKDCQAVRAYPREEHEFVLEYDITVWPDPGHRPQRVFGELVGEGAEQRCAEILEKLKTRRRAQLSRRVPTDLVTCLPSLGLILRLPGLDERLHGLKLALDPVAMRPILSHGMALDGSGLSTQGIDILGHRLGKRCVIRYHVEAPDSSARGGVARSLIGKVYKSRDGRGSRVFAAMRGLWERGFRDGVPDRIRIPRPLAYVPEGQLLLMEDAPGSSLEALEGVELESAIEAAGRAIAKLHRCHLEVPGRHTVEDEVALVERWVAVVCQVHSGMTETLVGALAKVRGALDRCRGVEPTLVHRDFYERQVLVQGAQTILIDFDTLCLADPAIDVGNFLAHLRLRELKRPGRGGGLATTFLAAYDPGPSADLSARIEAYTRSSLLRLGCLYALWPRWSHVTRPLVEAIT